jgi:hypothetical protein
MAIASFAAGQSLNAGDAVYLTPGGLAFKASGKTKDQASVVGVSLDSGFPGSLVRINLDDVYTSYSNLVPGNSYYLSITNSGALVAYSGWSSEFVAYGQNAYLQFVGRAVSSSGLSVETGTPVFVASSGF